VYQKPSLIIIQIIIETN